MTTGVTTKEIVRMLREGIIDPELKRRAKENGFVSEKELRNLQAFE